MSGDHYGSAAGDNDIGRDSLPVPRHSPRGIQCRIDEVHFSAWSDLMLTDDSSYACCGYANDDGAFMASEPSGEHFGHLGCATIDQDRQGALVNGSSSCGQGTLFLVAVSQASHDGSLWKK